MLRKHSYSFCICNLQLANSCAIACFPAPTSPAKSSPENERTLWSTPSHVFMEVLSVCTWRGKRVMDHVLGNHVQIPVPLSNNLLSPMTYRFILTPLEWMTLHTGYFSDLICVPEHQYVN